MLRIRDFTVGNTITASVALYKQNWRQYLKLSFIAHLWLFIPVYGWARYFAIAAWISKLSLQKFDSELNNRHFSEYFSFRSLFVLSFTGIFAIFVAIILGYLSSIILGFIISAFSELISQAIFSFSLLDVLGNILSNREGTAYRFLTYFGLLFFSSISIWFYTRLFLTDLIYIYRPNNKLFDPVKQSYHLTKNNKLKIYSIIWLSFLITFPIWVICYSIAPVTAWLIFTTTSINTFEAFSPLLEICFIVTLVCAHVIVLPFWQSVKASVFYYLTQNNNEPVR